mmetsp:Transcript_44825/g.66522  ORF Transcript_44825/g.66522 Transcript_44825/m.66522 type:complete len:80 (-) Transcript_44825:348-587(-)
MIEHRSTKIQGPHLKALPRCQKQWSGVAVPGTTGTLLVHETTNLSRVPLSSRLTSAYLLHGPLHSILLVEIPSRGRLST